MNYKVSIPYRLATNKRLGLKKELVEVGFNPL